MRAPRTRFGLHLEALESRMVLSGLTLAPAPHAPGHRAAQVERAVTPLELGTQNPDEVKIRNETSFPILVKATLLGTGLPTITKVIGPKSLRPTLFSFGLRRPTDASIAIDVSRNDHGTTPPPITITLEKPAILGYYGQRYKVSEIDGQFQVSM
jgi:hypothetical protein